MKAFASILRKVKEFNPARRARAPRAPFESGVLVGVDGTRQGWLAAWMRDGAVALQGFRGLDQLLAELRPQLVAIDMPIGLPRTHAPGGRACEIEGRRMTRRGSSFFSTAPRDIVETEWSSYHDALAAMRARHAAGISQQSYAILPKMREVDAIVRAVGQERIIEVHPELSFFCLAGRPLDGGNKKQEAGQRLRRTLLEAEFGPLPVLDAGSRGRAGVGGMDDRLDAVAALWTAGRVAAGQAIRLPAGSPPVDDRGLRMELWA